MKKTLAILFTIMTVLSCSVFASAELASEEPVSLFEEATTESATALTDFSAVTGGTEITAAESTTATTAPAETTTQQEVEQPSQVESVESLIVAGHGYVSLSLDGVETNVTIIIADKKGKEYTLEFKAEENYIVQQSLPVGEYTIKSVKSTSDDYKIKNCHIVDSDKTSFTVTETDFMSIQLTATEKKELFIIGFFKREWYMLAILAGLVIAYMYKRTHRILPSQES